MKERIRMWVNKDDQFDLDFVEGRLPDVYDVVIGKHHVCGGFVTKTATSRGLNYFLVCGKCCLRREVPIGVRSRNDLLGLFIREGFHQPGEEVRICINCEGEGSVFNTRYEEKQEMGSFFPKTATKEVTERIPCSDCKATGILGPVLVSS